MRTLLNTLYVTSQDIYLALDGENVVMRQDKTELRRIPLHNIEGIVTFSYTGASPVLMGACAKRQISLAFMTQNGRFIARVVGEEHGNVLLRKAQYRVSDSEADSITVAKNMLIAKLHNSRWVLELATRDHQMQLDVQGVQRAARFVADAIPMVKDAACDGELRGIEGEAALRYFSVFDELILQQKDTFRFNGRNRRPPLDPVNALLSFTYTLLMNEISAACAAVGLDPYIGFLHRDRPGRRALALDMMEELRAPLADRFVLTVINTRQAEPKGFHTKENGAVIMDDDTRRSILSAWQKRKQEQLVHPFLKEKIMWGLVPHVQALLLARHLRGDLDEYPPFLWK
jgi:CRISPR-associated protein Cas1